MNDFTKLGVDFGITLYSPALTTATCLESDKSTIFLYYFVEKRIGIAMQSDVNSNRYKIDSTMKPLTVKSTGQMNECLIPK
ncbi:hypothetical protein EZS27_021121 [termite gut metagenome]|uniref:Uncharacterized protein n=1 Tax=termite gut metagenome TaxID=433724 RepID=A0A5J4R9V8_9ZZZZ